MLIPILRGACAALLFGAAGASAAKAETYTTIDHLNGPQGGSIFLDLDSIHRNGGFADGWSIVVYYRDQWDGKQSPRGTALVQAHDYYDCVNRRERTGDEFYYDASFARIHSESGSGWEEVAPGTVEETEWKAACIPSFVPKDRKYDLPTMRELVKRARSYALEHGWNK